MNPTISTYPNLRIAIRNVQQHLKYWGVHLETESWQGVKQPREFFEALNVSFSAPIPQTKEELADEVLPNMPWAENHFKERIGGEPLNPGNQYKNWPYYKNNPLNDQFRTTEGGKFSHTYMERFWPKHAGMDGHKPIGFNTELAENCGIRFQFGDYSDLKQILFNEPYTRQAYLPIWFPEDGVAATKGERVPCTLGYHFIRRGKTLNITYYIRSCDLFRHFKDDIYLACRLVMDILWDLSLEVGGPGIQHWKEVKPGMITMHITSLHIFSQEYNLL